MADKHIENENKNDPSQNVALMTRDEPIPFGSNAVRLSPRQWAIALLLVVVLAIGLPRAWRLAEPMPAGPDFRIPYALSDDYWLYQRHIAHVAKQQRVAVIGDSVIWGEYVEPDGTLTHYLNEAESSTHFANAGLNGTHPLALTGLIADYSMPLSDTRVILHCNLLWMSSAERDLSVEKELQFNHASLVPQFFPRIPCYKATIAERMGNVVDRNIALRGWARHLRIMFYDNLDLPTWTLEHPYSNPLGALWHAKSAVAELPRYPVPLSWVERGIEPQELPWVDMETSLQWRAFRDCLQQLERRRNRVFVFVSPLNEHMMLPESRRRYLEIQTVVDRWLGDRGVASCVGPLLPSEEYADLSHPLSVGYARLAREIVASESFQRWLER